MELIIKISDKVYNRIKSDNGHGYCALRDQDERVIVDAICNGIRLAKGHGNIIDVDTIKCIVGWHIYASLILGADRENSNETDN